MLARSSAEASTVHGICKALWLKILLKELGVTMEGSLKIYCDNKAATDISHNPIHHDRTKHVEVDRHFIREKIDESNFYNTCSNFRSGCRHSNQRTTQASV